MAVTEQQRQAVLAAIVQPMVDYLGQPYGFGEEAAARKSEQYVAALAEYPAPTLSAAWERVRDSYGGKGWPSIKLLREACDAKQALLDGPARKSSKAWLDGFWPEVEERHTEFRRQYELGALATQAKAEGWWFDLDQHVRRCAHMQAQIVVRLERQGKPITTEGYSRSDIEYYRLDDMERAGDISVSVPAAEIADMKECARQQTEAMRKRQPKTHIGRVAPSVDRAAWEAKHGPKAKPREDADPTIDPDLPGAPAGPEPPPLESEHAEELEAAV